MKKFQNENEKNKKIEETSETESFDEYENEAMENAENGSLFEEISLSKSGLPFDVGQITGSISSSEKETRLEGNLKDSLEERKNLLLEKWFTVTGKKPRNIPTLKRYFTEAAEKIVFFGDRCPLDREKKRTQKMLLEVKKIEKLGIVYGKIQKEIQMPALSPGLQCVRFAPNLEYIATADRSGLVQIRKFSTGVAEKNLKTIEIGEKIAIKSLKYYPGNSERIFVVGEAGVIQVFNTFSGDLLEISNCIGVINTMDISPDGSVLAVGGRNGNLRTFDPVTLQEIWSTAWPDADEIMRATVEDECHRLRIYAIKFHPTETHLFASGACDNSVKIWDVRVPKAIRSVRGPSIFGEGLDLVGNRIITASWQSEKSLNLWDFSSGQLIKNISLENKSTAYEGEFLYSAQFFKEDPAYSWITSEMVAVGGCGFKQLLVINIETEKVLEYFPSFKAVVTLDIIGNLIVYGGKESTFRVAEIERKRKTRQY